MTAPDEDQGRSQGDRLTKAMLIGDARRVAETPCIVREDDSLVDAARALSAHRGVDIVMVVDAAGKLVGVIPARLLVDELFLQVAPEEFLADIFDRERMEEYGRMVRARTAGDLMRPPVYLTAADTIGEAFKLMREEDLEAVPIVDDEMRPAGYLERLELINVWLQEHRSDGPAN